MYSRAIHFDNAVLSYDVQGHGPHALLMFHGAGQDRSVFRSLPAALLDSFRIYTFDLFFHGESSWTNDGVPIDKETWKHFIAMLRDAEQIGTQSVFGYSIGARFALATLEAFPRQTAACFLVAPDGISDNIWFRIATYSPLFRKLFRNLAEHPARFDLLLRLASGLRVVDASTARFAATQMNDDTKRWRVYHSWTTFRLLVFDRAKLRNLIDSNNIRLCIFVGRRDRMVPEAPIRIFLTRLKSARLEIIEAHHRNVLNEALARLASTRA